MTHTQFIESKILQAKPEGFTVNDFLLHSSSKPHQSDIIEWGALGGKRAIFASFGLGKTQIQLELARLVVDHYNVGSLSRSDKLVQKKALIICPLGVKGEFKKDAERLCIDLTYVTTMQEYKSSPSQICITNYERVRDGDIRPDENMIFISLDEASILRSLGSKTYIEFNKIFRSVPFRYVATATPSPNDYIELLNYASFLGIMDVGQAKIRFFKRDSTKADSLTLLPHKEEEFWLWVSSWAIFITKPSDLGYDDTGYDLPELIVRWHCLPSDPNKIISGRDGQTKLVDDGVGDLAKEAKIKRESIDQRIAKAKELLSPLDYCEERAIIWHHLEAERVAIEKAYRYATSVYGSQTVDEKEYFLTHFANGDLRHLATKLSIAGQGCNFQYHCHHEIFLGIDHKFNAFIQGIHRVHRFMQKHTCYIDVIYMDTEEHIRRDLERKWKQHNEQLEIMTSIIRKYGLSHSNIDGLKRAMNVERKELAGTGYKLILNDNVKELESWEDNCIDCEITSIPFSIQYEYTPNYNDFGHNESNEKFFEQMDFLVPHMFRVLRPGRILAVHVKDRIEFGNWTGNGFPTLYPFSDEASTCFRKHGFELLTRVSIPTDVVRENKQTNRLGWTENSKDGTKMGNGVPEYILVFRKPQTDGSRGYADVPVPHEKQNYTRARWQIDAHSMYKTNGDLYSPEDIAAMNIEVAMKIIKQETYSLRYDYDRHVAIAEALERAGKLPTSFMAVEPMSSDPDVWTDVTRMRGLNTMQGQRKEKQHLCPLPFDIVNRLITRYTNPGDIILDPFGGIMTVPYCATKNGRIGYGIELNEGYWKDGCYFLQELEAKKKVQTLFEPETVTT